MAFRTISSTVAGIGSCNIWSECAVQYDFRYSRENRQGVLEAGGFPLDSMMSLGER